MQDNPIATLAYPPNSTWEDPEFHHCQGVTECIKTWALRILDSRGIFIYAPGVYSFFQNYDVSCTASHSCQNYAVELDRSQYVYIYDMYSIGHDYMILMDGWGLVPESENLNGFGQSIALFEFL